MKRISAIGCVTRALNGAQPLAQPIDPASARPRCRIGSRDDHCSSGGGGEPIGPRIEKNPGTPPPASEDDNALKWLWGEERTIRRRKSPTVSTAINDPTI